MVEGSQTPVSVRRNKRLSIGAVLLDEQDDEAELRNRHLAQTAAYHIDSPKRASQGPGARQVTNAQVAEHYDNCLKLSQDNKITVKNAFSLHLIDYMANMVRESTNGSTNFQLASCTLDASAKIYAYRVDCVHQETIKMAGGLGIMETKNKDGTSSEENAECGDDHNLATNQKKKPQKKTRHGNTIERNLQKITLGKIQLNFEADTLFKTNSASEENCTRGLLLNHIEMINDAGILAFDASHSCFYRSSTEFRTDADTTFSATWGISAEALAEKNPKICPTLSGFRFNDWDPNKTQCDANNTTIKSQQENVQDPFTYDADAPVNDDDDYDGGGMDCDDNGENRDENNQTGLANATMRAGSIRCNDVSTISAFLAQNPTDYSYFNKNMLSGWAGPGHWKMKPIRRHTSVKTTTETGSAQRKKRAVKGLKIDWDQDPSIDMRPTTNQLTKLTCQAWVVDKTTLPPDLHLGIDSLTCIFYKPKMRMRRARREAEVDAEVGGYNYENDNDKSFCPNTTDLEHNNSMDAGPGAADDHDDDFEGFPAATAGDPFTQATIGDDLGYGGEPLVDQPNRVEKIQIAYAKQAKKIDMKQLKTAMWKSLTKSNEQDKENALPACEDKMASRVPFSHMYREMRPLLSSMNNRNMSVPIAFVALLHMCNERILRIEQQQNAFDDIIIMQD